MATTNYTSEKRNGTEPNPQEQRARELLTQRPTFIGTDSDDAAHYFDTYEQAVAVVDRDGSAEKIELADSPFETIQEWCEYTRDQRNWDVGPRVGGSLLGDLREALR